MRTPRLDPAGSTGASPAGIHDDSSSGKVEPDARFILANERTLLAWNRTALALVAAALAVEQLLTGISRTGRLVIAATLAALASALGVASRSRWLANQRALQKGEALSSTRLPTFLALGVSTVALICAVVLAAELIT